MSGITAAGFVRKTRAEIRADIVDRIRSAFGSVYTDPDSVLGREIDNYTDEMDALWQQLENVYHSQYRTTAAGESLSQAVRNIGVARLPQLQTRVQITITGSSGTTIPVGSSVEISETEDRFDTAEEVEIGAGGTVDVEAVAQEFGPIQAPAGAIDTIVTPIAGWSSVTNAEDETLLGRNVETDIDLRARAEADLQVASRATEEAIRSRLRQDVPGVTGATVISNRSSSTVDGRPPKSFESLVQGGDEDAIAELIWETMPAGIEPHGTISKNVTDSEGDLQTVKFSRPVEVEYYIRITLTKTSEYPSGGDASLKNSVFDFAAETFDVGDDIVQHLFYTPVNELDGITEAIIEIGTSDGYTVTYTEDNLDLDSDEIGDLPLDNITIATA